MADGLIPNGHKLSSIGISPADNGVTVNHTTKKVNPSKKDGYDGTYKEHSRVFESPEGATRHVSDILRAHSGRVDKGKRFGSRSKGGCR